ncbi:DNA-binding response regulator [Flexivirga endophytica]|uniref:DNA-binding response regulator n=1 Tax=Flexivirga endophytica TaxID=1849103 RepID=A0A916TDH6_9MICO|nr:response regulator transcription factor [Flexivirga endophytica]GGB39267.1 DNA-binding response regulator [Flexivirga endophytica]GHB47190.1 DNA-binding response regulator [Flexivirga endophytica]
MTDIPRTKGGAGAAPAPLPARPEVVRTLLVEDYKIYRHGLRMILDLEDDIAVVGETGSAVEALEMAEATAPDVVVLDILLPDGSGLQVCRKICARLPDTKVLMLTASDEDSDLVESVKAGATGYLLKDIAPDQLPMSIRAVASGKALLSPELGSTLLSEYSALVRGAPARDDEPTGELTDRELEVLGLVARGWSNRKIAEELFIAENTVKNHVRNILDKLQLRSRMQAALYAVRGGLVDDQAE